jgi:hypothetical protein
MIIAAVVFLVIAALFGSILLVYILANKETPKAIAIMHGGAAAIGLILLIVHGLLVMDYQLLIIAGIFFIAAVLGSYLFSKDIFQKPIPKTLVLLHGLVAASNLGYLIYLVFKQT